MDAEQDVFEAVLLNHMVASFEQYAGIDAIVKFAAAGNAQAAQRNAVPADADDCAMAGAANFRLSASLQRERLGDAHRPGIRAWREP